HAVAGYRRYRGEDGGRVRIGTVYYGPRVSVPVLRQRGRVAIQWEVPPHSPYIVAGYYGYSEKLVIKGGGILARNPGPISAAIGRTGRVSRCAGRLCRRGYLRGNVPCQCHQ